MRKFIVVALLALLSMKSFGQFDPNYKRSNNRNNAPAEYKEPLALDEPLPIGNFGLGLGLDYGGIGVHLEFMPQRSLALFGSVGYNFNGAGYNFGGKVHILPKSNVCPTLIGMYGYNAVIIIEGASDLNETYLGPTFGTGVNFKSSRNHNFISAELLIPSRSEDYHNAIDNLQNAGIEITPAWPIAISFGYHLSF